MRRLDFYHIRNDRMLAYVVDVQADILDHLTTRVVVPLIPVAVAPLSTSDLNPVFEIEGVAYVMQTQQIAAVLRTSMGARAGSLDAHHDEITRALDTLLLGF